MQNEQRKVIIILPRSLRNGIYIYKRWPGRNKVCKCKLDENETKKCGWLSLEKLSMRFGEHSDCNGKSRDAIEWGRSYFW